MDQSKQHVAYFSMEIALHNNIPNYAGGLGVLAADTIQSLADLEVNAIGVSLVYHKNDDFNYAFAPERYMIELPHTVSVDIQGRPVTLKLWQLNIRGKTGHTVPVIFLSTYSHNNELWDRDIAKHLYAPDRYTRLCQEVVLGIGGVRALKKLGYNVSQYQLNEGHSSFLALELLRTHNHDIEKVRSMCNFTTHTPIPAGHEYFEYNTACDVLGDLIPHNIKDLAGQDKLGMTQLALNTSKKTNSVSKRHQKVCENMFPDYKIGNVTNGVYLSRWAGDAIKQLLDPVFPNWELNPEQLVEAPKKLQSDLLHYTRVRQKEWFVNWINRHQNFFMWNNPTEGDFLDADVLTIGFARRFVPYKRPDLIFRHIPRLASIGDKKIQIVFANRCHPSDGFCTGIRKMIREHAHTLRGRVRVVVVPDYDLYVAKRLVTGCDVWLNTPISPREASGTSGMKAALNGGLNLSVLDGWWIEGHAKEPASGWSFGNADAQFETMDDAHRTRVNDEDSDELLNRLEEIVECYYDRPDEWNDRMKHAIALAAHFNTHRVVQEYTDTIWEDSFGMSE